MNTKENDAMIGKAKEKKESAFLTDLKPDKEEINRLYERLDINHSIRNQLLMFSFTSVIASLGAALAIEDISVPLTYLFLFPLVILIPFQARISYYRLEEAHVLSYLRKLSPDTDKYGRLCRNGFSENNGLGKISYTIVAWLVNHELVCLGTLSASIFCMKFFISTKTVTKRTLVAGLLPTVVLLGALFLIADSTYAFRNMSIKYENRLNELQIKYDRRKEERNK